MLWLYRNRFVTLAREGLRGRHCGPAPGREALAAAHIAVACAPAFALGALLHAAIKAHLFSSRPVVIGLWPVAF